MSIRNNRTVMSEGGYAAKTKYNQYVLEQISKEAGAILRKEEQQRLINAAKSQAALTMDTDPRMAGSAAVPRVNRSESTAFYGGTDPRMSSVKPGNPFGKNTVVPGNVDPRTEGFANKPKNPYDASVALQPLDETDPRFYSKAEKPAVAKFFEKKDKPEQKQGIIQNYSNKNSFYKSRGGIASLFDGKPNNLKSATASDFNKARGAGVADVAGNAESIRKLVEEIDNIRENGPVLTPRERQLYDSTGVADVAGNKEIYDWTEDVKEFFERPGTFYSPMYQTKTNLGKKILNKTEYKEENYNSDNKMSFVPRWREQQKMDESFIRRYEEGEKILNQEEFDTNFEANVIASINRFRAMPAKTFATILNITADCIDSLSYNQKSEFCNWLRSMEDNSELLEKSERQYSQIDYDNEFINELAVGVGKGLADMSSSAFIGGIVHISPDLLSDIYSAGEIYNTAREKGYSVEQAMAESGLMFTVNRGVGNAYDSLKDTVSNRGMKSVLEILKNTTTTTAEDAWLENNGEEGALSLEGIANTLAVEAVIQAIVKGAPYIGKKFAKSFLV